MHRSATSAQTAMRVRRPGTSSTFSKTVPPMVTSPTRVTGVRDPSATSTSTSSSRSRGFSTVALQDWAAPLSRMAPLRTTWARACCPSHSTHRYWGRHGDLQGLRLRSRGFQLLNSDNPVVVCETTVITPGAIPFTSKIKAVPGSTWSTAISCATTRTTTTVTTALSTLRRRRFHLDLVDLLRRRGVTGGLQQHGGELHNGGEASANGTA